MFRPRDSINQRLLAAKLRVKPQPHNVHWSHDVFGNCIAIVDIAESAKELCFETSIRVDHTPHAPLDLRMDDEAQTYPFAYGPEETTTEELVRICESRWRIEDCLAEAKGEVGLDHYEVRRWNAWHRHATLCQQGGPACGRVYA